MCGLPALASLQIVDSSVPAGPQSEFVAQGFGNPHTFLERLRSMPSFPAQDILLLTTKFPGMQVFSMIGWETVPDETGSVSNPFLFSKNIRTLPHYPPIPSLPDSHGIQTSHDIITTLAVDFDDFDKPARDTLCAFFAPPDHRYFP
ncbi:hypothetical protein FB451DRAFT_1394789 [Mycena latifolia]|nr:hypothetical protein FB451DRAFT_1394789 [Mycena latifolia]